MVIERYWTGIGSRKTPFEVCLQMMEISRRIEQCHKYNYILRSGGADGADMAFERGINNEKNKEIYLPWKRFNMNRSHLYNTPKEAFEIAALHHPAWEGLKQSVQALMARNVLQILGQDMHTPSRFVFCWTEDGCEHAKTRTRKTGGTGLAISLASAHDIPVYNLKKRSQDEVDRIIRMHTS